MCLRDFMSMSWKFHVALLHFFSPGLSRRAPKSDRAWEAGSLTDASFLPLSCNKPNHNLTARTSGHKYHLHTHTLGSGWRWAPASICSLLSLWQLITSGWKPHRCLTSHQPLSPPPPAAYPLFLPTATVSVTNTLCLFIHPWLPLRALLHRY